MDERSAMLRRLKRKHDPSWAERGWRRRVRRKAKKTREAAKMKLVFAIIRASKIAGERNES